MGYTYFLENKYVTHICHKDVTHMLYKCFFTIIKWVKKIESQNIKKKTGQDNIVRKTNAKFKKPRCIGCRDMMHLV